MLKLVITTLQAHGIGQEMQQQVPLTQEQEHAHIQVVELKIQIHTQQQCNTQT